MKIKKPAKWDGEWRIVIFDIPKDLKSQRGAKNEIERTRIFRIAKIGASSSV